MAGYEVDNFEKALFDTAQRIIEKAVALGEEESGDLSDSVRTLLIREAPKGMPLSWIIYLRNVATALGEEEVDTQRQAILRRVGDAIVEAIDEGQVDDLQ